jgi:phospholipid transport system substrate-binding protein
MRRTLLLLALALAALAPSADPAAFIRDLGRRLPQVMAGPGTQAERRAALRSFLSGVVAVDRTARFCLGRYWLAATPAQRTAYEGLFLDLLTKSVAERFGQYREGQSRIAIEAPQVRADGTYVPTIVQGADGPPANVTWVIDTTTEPYRVLDVVAEGMSLRLAERSDFAGYLDRHGGDIDAFLAALRERAR